MSERKANHHFKIHAHIADALVNHEELCDLKEAMQILDRSRMRVRAYIKEEDNSKMLNLKTARKIKNKFFIERDEVEQLAKDLLKKSEKNREQREENRAARELRSLKRVQIMIARDDRIDSELQEEMLTYLELKLREES